MRRNIFILYHKSFHFAARNAPLLLSNGGFLSIFFHVRFHTLFLNWEAFGLLRREHFGP